MNTSQLPARPAINPLTTEDEALLRQVCSRCEQLADLIERAKLSGLDVSEYEARNNLHSEVAHKLLDQFFPAKINQIEA